MDRQSKPILSALSRIPHPRGDGPSLSRMMSLIILYSPPTWGWTGAEINRSASVLVFPTHVGMDRRASRVIKRAGGIPHPRGDGPSSCDKDCPKLSYSPPTWGWTGTLQGQFSLRFVFPTHVGMDRCDACCEILLKGIPHPRGDGPQQCTIRESCQSYSPPTWGWTAAESLAGLPRHVFPTHVGMDRSAHSRSVMSASIPHPRGDGPIRASFLSMVLTYSPPTWGWTVDKIAVIAV